MTTLNTDRTESGMTPSSTRQEPSLAGWSTLRRRRILVAGLLISLVGYMAGETAGHPMVTLLGLISFIAAALMVRRTTHAVADKPAELLDERQVGVRNRSYLMAYRLTAGAVAVAMIAAIALAQTSIPKQFVITALSGMLFFSIVAPSCVVAWTEREA